MAQVSSLVDCTVSDNNKCNRGRNGQTVKKITVHYQSSHGEPESVSAGWANPKREASSNYIIGPTGRVGLCVPEEDRSWCSDSPDNDYQAITIEVSSDPDYSDQGSTTQIGKMDDAAYEKCILLCADICTRYGFKLYYTGDSSGTLTTHRMFVPTACPGKWFLDRIDDFVDAVNKKVESGVFTPDDYDDSYEPVEEPPVYDYYLITSTSKQNQPGECGNKITGSVYLGRW